VEDCPLFVIYHEACKEADTRLKTGEGGRKTQLSIKSLEHVKRTLESAVASQSIRLESGLILLALAVSGAPFLGLLGTVVGVMITFAAIAAAGDVNVNAIAPGISAALLATVAGLFVAIPALFGYNYLLTRNKAVTANMQVFVDEFVTRLAELHRDADLGAAA
jgi:biopolymer transport protein ExbB